MYSFTACIILLVVGYFIYGRLVDRVFGSDGERRTPCFTKADGVDYVPLPTWKVYLIQFLNIAGTGPIFGAIMGILFGPAAFLWIVFGCIFAGAVHDYFVGMISIRKGGASIPEIVGDELGNGMRIGMRVFSLVLLVLVGAVFVITPAQLLEQLSPAWADTLFWIVVIFAYYILATLLPIDKLIARVYPLFGIALLVMAIGIGVGLYTKSGVIPELTELGKSVHPKGYPILPMLFITIACGAISGFHATQTPLMARCITNERMGRRVFYGSMVTEGVVALIWAAAAIKFAGTYEGLLNMGNPGIVVKNICSSWLGTAGAILAILGVVIAPISSGDTAFRSARLIAAEFLHFEQRKFVNRLMISLPLFAVAAVAMMLDFDVLWRYFAWCNQSLATIALWAITVWLVRNKRSYLVALVPAVFMTFICTSYILMAPEGFQIDLGVSYAVGGVVSVGLGVWFALKIKGYE